MTKLLLINPFAISYKKIATLYVVSFFFSWNIGDIRKLFLKLKTKLGLYHFVLTTPKTTAKKLTLTVAEMQQLPETEKKLIPKKSFLPKMHNIERKPKKCKLQGWYRQPQYCRVPLPKQFVHQRWRNWCEIDRMPVAVGETSLSIELHWHCFQTVHCTGRNNCS